MGRRTFAPEQIVAKLRQIEVLMASGTEAPHAARVSAASGLLDRGWGRPMQGHAVMAVAAPKSVREMTNDELMAMMEKRAALPHTS